MRLRGGAAIRRGDSKGMKMNSINITSKISNQLQQKLSLTPGKIIKAQVIKFEGNQVLLQLGNSLLKAQTKVQLNQGDRLKLQVEAAHQNSIELKIVNDAARQKPEDAALLKLGIRPQEEMSNILRQLVKFNLPISQATILELFSLIKGFKLTEDLTQLTVWLKTIGVKVESEQDFQALEGLKKFFKGEIADDKESRFLSFLNKSENNIYGGYNIFGWPLAEHHIFLLTQGSKRERLQPESCKLLLQLNSRNFEELWFKIELSKQELKAGLICNSDKYQSILATEVGGLCQALMAAGYKIDDIAVEVSDTKLTILDFINQQPSRLCDINYRV